MRASAQRSCAQGPSLAAAVMPSSCPTRRVAASRARRRSRGTVLAPSARHARWAPVLPRSRSSAAASRRSSPGARCSGSRAIQDSAAIAAARVGGSSRVRSTIARPIRRGARPRRGRDRRPAGRVRRRAARAFRRRGSCRVGDSRVDEANNSVNSSSLTSSRAASGSGACCSSSTARRRRPHRRRRAPPLLPCPAMRRGLRATAPQLGSADAMRRRVRKMAWARVSSWVGVRMSMPASCRTGPPNGRVAFEPERGRRRRKNVCARSSPRGSGSLPAVRRGGRGVFRSGQRARDGVPRHGSEGRIGLSIRSPRLSRPVGLRSANMARGLR